MYYVLTENEQKISQKSTSTAHNNNTISLSRNSQHGPNQLAPQNLVNMCKIGEFYHDISIINLLFI